MGRNQQIQALKIGNQMRSPAALRFFSNKAYRGLVCCGCPSVGWAGLVGATISAPEAVRRRGGWCWAGAIVGVGQAKVRTEEPCRRSLRP